MAWLIKKNAQDYVQNTYKIWKYYSDRLIQNSKKKNSIYGFVWLGAFRLNKYKYYSDVAKVSYIHKTPQLCILKIIQTVETAVFEFRYYWSLKENKLSIQYRITALQNLRKLYLLHNIIQIPHQRISFNFLLESLAFYILPWF